jgi:hypothetical protein
MSLTALIIAAFSIVVIHLLSLLRQSQHMQGKGKQMYMICTDLILMHGVVLSYYPVKYKTLPYLSRHWFLDICYLIPFCSFKWVSHYIEVYNTFTTICIYLSPPLKCAMLLTRHHIIKPSVFSLGVSFLIGHLTGYRIGKAVIKLFGTLQDFPLWRGLLCVILFTILYTIIVLGPSLNSHYIFVVRK